MVALAGNLDFSGSSFLTGLTAVFVAGLYNALAREVCTLGLLIGRDHDFSFLKFQSLETIVARSSRAFQKSICLTYENCSRKPKSADLGIGSAGRVDRYATGFVKRVGNDFKALAIHVYMPGRCVAEIPNLRAAIGASHCVQPFSPACVLEFVGQPGTSLFPDAFFDAADQFVDLASFFLRFA